MYRINVKDGENFTPETFKTLSRICTSGEPTSWQRKRSWTISASALSSLTCHRASMSPGQCFFIAFFLNVKFFTNSRETNDKRCFYCISTSQRKFFRNFHSLYENSIWKSPILDRFSDISGTKFSFFHIQRKISHSGRSDLRSWMWNFTSWMWKKNTADHSQLSCWVQYQCFFKLLKVVNYNFCGERRKTYNINLNFKPPKAV